MAKSKAVTKVATKAASKSAPIKAAAKADQFSAKLLGTTLIVTFQKKNYTRKAISKVDAKKITDKITLYNKQPKDSTRDTILKMVQPEMVKEDKKKDKVVAAKKGIKQQVKKVIKKEKAKDKGQTIDFIGALDAFLASDETAVDKIQAVLDKYKKVAPPIPEATVYEKPVRREAYKDGRRQYLYYNKAGIEVNEDGSPLTLKS